MKELIKNILKDFVLEQKKPTNQELIDLGKKYEYKKDFINHHRKEYNLAASRGILDTVIGHMKNSYRKSSLTDEDILNIALNYKYRSDFIKGNGNAYLEASKRNILDLVTSHMIDHPNKSNVRKYSNSELETIAKKYKHKSDFAKNDRNAYTAATSYGILDDITKHMTPLGNLVKRMIYVYEFPEYNTVYVGLTDNEERRKKEHLGPIILQRKTTTVQKFIEKTKSTPIYKVVSEGYIEYDEAQKLEDSLIKKYKEEGWDVLNKMKAGGLGGSWRYTNDDLQKIANKYTKKEDFKKNEAAAYQLASKRKILLLITNHMITDRRSHTDDDLQMIARQFSTKSDFMKNDSGAYSTANQRGILDKITTHMVGNSKFTDEELENIASNYKTKSEFKKGNRRAYSRAVARKLIDKITKHMNRPLGYNLKYSTQDFMDAAEKYKTKANLYKHDIKMYHAAFKREGMFELMFPVP